MGRWTRYRCARRGADGTTSGATPKSTTSRVRAACLAIVALAATAAPMRAAASDDRLVAAARAGDGQLVRTLLAGGADVKHRQPDGTTALHWAARQGDAEIVQHLLRQGADPNAANRYGVTPLAGAAASGSLSIVRLLLTAGADPNAALVEGETVLMAAARTGRADVVQALVAGGANPNGADRVFGETALMWAAGENHAGAVRALAAGGADLEARSTVQDDPVLNYPRTGFDKTSLPRGGWTALMYAARQGSADAVSALAAAGANLDAADPDGTTALVLAIINAQYDVARLLLERGADPNIADRTGMAPLYAAVDMHSLPWIMGRPDPQPAPGTSAIDIIGQLLARGADPNAVLAVPILRRQHTDGDPALGRGATPFMRAAKTGDLAAMRLLVARGADPARVQDNGTTALMLAAGLGWRDTDDVRDRAPDGDVIAALEFCLEQGLEIGGRNRAGDTALHAAAARGSAAIVTLLVDRGADVAATNTQGRTPLDVATRVRGGRGAAAAEILRRHAGAETSR